MNISSTRSSGVALVLTTAALVVLGTVPPASATYAGTAGRLFFSSDRAGGQDLWSMNADGSRLARLTTDGTSLSPAVSPDGTRVAYVSGGDVWTMAIDGTRRVQVTDTAFVEQSPTWSPDALRLAFVATGGSSDAGTDAEIFVRQADGAGPTTQLTVNTFSDTRPSWSPVLSGHPAGRIAFVSARSGDTDRNIYVMDADGGNVANLTPASTYEGLPYQGHDDDPSWSPDGRIAYTHTFLPNAGGLPAVWVTNPSGSGRQRVSTDSTTSASDPAWSPDGLRIAYVGTAGTDRNIAVMTLDGNGSHVDTQTSHDISPDWQEDSVDPETVLTAKPVTATDTAASVGFASNEPGSTFECRLDQAAFGPCSSPYSVSDLAIGAHSVSVRAIDPVGRPDPTPAIHTWSVLAPPVVVPPVVVPAVVVPTTVVPPVVVPPVVDLPVAVPPTIHVAIPKRVVLGQDGGTVRLSVMAGPAGSRVKLQVSLRLKGARKVIATRSWTVSATKVEKVRLRIADRWRKALGDRVYRARVSATTTSMEGASASAKKVFDLSR